MKRMLSAVVLAAAVAVPAGSALAQQSDKSIVGVAASDARFSTLVSLVKQAGLADTLSSTKLTVFAPTNAAFKKVPKATLRQLAAHPAQLRAVLTYHAVAGRLPAAKVVKRTSLKTVNGARIHVRVRNGHVYLNGTARVVATDIKASNGIVHVINRVLLPPSK